MKARPRSVENRVADALNDHFRLMGCSPVERIPVLGRTGPDISINEMNLVVDVKSRREVPKSIFFPLSVPFAFDGMVAARLTNLNTLWEPEHVPALLDFSSKLIRGYLEHMEEWTKAKAPGGVSCVILHRPEMPVGSSVAVIHSHNRRRLFEYAERRYEQQRDRDFPAE